MATPTKRYYISKTRGDGGEFNPYSLEIHDHDVPMSAVTDYGVKNWALVIAETDDHSAIIADNDITPLPDFPIDGRLSSINTSTVVQMVLDLKALGIDAWFTVAADGYADVIQGIGEILDANFDVYNFKITE